MAFIGKPSDGVIKVLMNAGVDVTVLERTNGLDIFCGSGLIRSNAQIWKDHS